jgi:hypothetical protein
MCSILSCPKRSCNISIITFKNLLQHKVTNFLWKRLRLLDLVVVRKFQTTEAYSSFDLIRSVFRHKG